KRNKLVLSALLLFTVVFAVRNFRGGNILSASAATLSPAFDLSGSANSGLWGVNTLSINLNVSTNPNRILILGVVQNSTMDGVTSVTYAGRNLSELASSINAGGEITTDLWYLVN